MTAPSTGRDRTVDALRGLAIVLVVLGHINRGMLERQAGMRASSLGMLDFYLYTVHMPIFFYLAGYYAWQAIAKHSVAYYLTSRWHNIIYPYIFWSVLTFAAHQLGTMVTSIHHSVSVVDLALIAWAPINVLWFLYALLLMQLVALVARRHPWALLVAALITSSVWSLFLPVNAFGIIGKSALHVPFFACGFSMASAGKKPIPDVLHLAPVVIAALLVFAVGCAAAVGLGATAPVTLTLLPLSLCGMIALAGVVRWSSSSMIGRHLVRLGTLSLPIYLLHSFVLAIVPRLLARSGYDTIALELAVGTIVGVYGSWAAFSVLRRGGLDGVTGLNPTPAPHLSSARQARAR